MQTKINNKIYVIILASGIGKRIQHHSLPKQFLKLAGKTVIEHTIEAFEKNNLIDEIIIVNHPNYRDYLENIIAQRKFKKNYKNNITIYNFKKINNFREYFISRNHI